MARQCVRWLFSIGRERVWVTCSAPFGTFLGEIAGAVGQVIYKFCLHSGCLEAYCAVLDDNALPTSYFKVLRFVVDHGRLPPDFLILQIPWKMTMPRDIGIWYLQTGYRHPYKGIPLSSCLEHCSYWLYQKHHSFRTSPT